MRPSRIPLSCFGVVVLVTWCGPLSVAAEEVVFARHLAVSPDGQTLAFSWAGDIWTVPIAGGSAARLTAHPAHDSHPVWSRDGEHLAFASDRHGAANVFVMGRNGSGVRRLTFSDRAEIPTDWSPDGDGISFHSQREGDVYREPRVYRVPTAGGQSWRVMDCHGASARVSPDGFRLVFVRGSTPWWRRGYRGSADFDVYLCTTKADTFVRLTDFDGNDRLPIWDAEGRAIYFLSDRGGSSNVWRQPLEGRDAEQITRMTGDDVRDFSLSADGKTLAFTHWNEIYVMATADRLARAVKVTAGDDAARNDVELRTFTKDADETEVSPDGKEMALVVHGEIFVIRTEDDKPTRRVTNSPARDQHVTWSPDGKALLFVSDRAGQEDIYRAVSAEDPPLPLSESLRFKIERVTSNPALEYAPAVSPDGKKLAFVRQRGDLIIRDLKTGEESVLLESWSRPAYAWSPDSRWIAYHVEDVEHNPDVWVVPADGWHGHARVAMARAVNISQHPDYDGSPRWSADGQMLAFASRRHGFDTDLYVVFLAPELHEQSAVELDEYFEQQAEAVKKRKPLKSAVASGEIALAGVAAATQPAESRPAESQPTTTQAADEGAVKMAALDLRSRIRGWLKEFLEEPDEKEEEPEEKAEKRKYEYELETCYRRVRRVTTLPGDQTGFAFSPDGQLLAFASAHEGDAKLFTIKWNGKDQKRIVSADVAALHWGLDGKKLYYLKGGVPHSCSESGSGAKAHKFRAKMAVAHSAEAAQKFDDGARQLGMRFYHPTMKGLDWPGLTRKYRDLALHTRTTTGFNEVFNMLLGELNASHVGVYGPHSGGQEQVGYLGCSLDRTFAGPGLKVATVLPRSPADRAASKLAAGDVILRINGEPVGPDRALERALINTVGDEVIVEFIPSSERENEKEEAAEGQEAAKEAEEVAESEAAGQGAAPQSPKTQEVVIRPVSWRTIRGLRYDAWVMAGAKHVAEKSQGRLGYVHIRGMGKASFQVFERDLYAAAHGREGLIVDVRNNGGGWTADWVMAVLSVRRHAYTVQRGGEPGYPQDRLIFYAWTEPVTMMCNQQSFSNAEILAHAFKNLGRGPLVGMTTFGGVISTGEYRLIDGAHVRMPMRGWYTLPDGLDMENNGAVPDVKVPVTPEDEVRGRRPQLDAAIAATLAQLGPEETRP